MDMLIHGARDVTVASYQSDNKNTIELVIRSNGNNDLSVVLIGLDDDTSRSLARKLGTEIIREEALTHENT